MLFNKQAHSYRRIIETFGYEILFWREFGILQGDSFVLLKKDSDFGYLVIGWGSCLGCDVLMRTTTAKEFIELENILQNKIFWGTASGIIKHIAEDCYDWYLYEEDFVDLFKEAVEIIKENI